MLSWLGVSGVGGTSAAVANDDTLEKPEDEPSLSVALTSKLYVSPGVRVTVVSSKVC